MTPRDATVGRQPASEEGKAQRAIGTPARQGAKPSAEPARADDTAYVEDVYHEVEGAIQDGVDRLAKRRSCPILG